MDGEGKTSSVVSANTVVGESIVVMILSGSVEVTVCVVVLLGIVLVMVVLNGVVTLGRTKIYEHVFKVCR